MIWQVRCAAIVILCTFSQMTVRASVIAYSNQLNPTGVTFPNGGAQVIAGDDITRMVADDITISPAAVGLKFSQISFTAVYEGQVSFAPFRPRLRFYAADNNGQPGTILGSYDLPTLTVGTGLGGEVSLTTSSGFTIPAAASNGVNFWLGVIFDDNNGTTGISSGDLNQIRLIIDSPPSVGSSQNFCFQTTSAGAFTSNNPTGSDINPFPTHPANFNFIIQAVPDPSGLSVLSLAVLPLLHRRRKPSVVPTARTA